MAVAYVNQNRLNTLYKLYQNHYHLKDIPLEEHDKEIAKELEKEGWIVHAHDNIYPFTKLGLTIYKEYFP